MITLNSRTDQSNDEDLYVSDLDSITLNSGTDQSVDEDLYNSDSDSKTSSANNSSVKSTNSDKSNSDLDTSIDVVSSAETSVNDLSRKAKMSSTRKKRQQCQNQPRILYQASKKQQVLMSQQVQDSVLKD